MTPSPTTDRTAATAPTRRERTPAWAWVLCCALAALAAPVLIVALITLFFSSGGDPFEPLSPTAIAAWAVVALLCLAVPVLACRLTLRSRYEGLAADSSKAWWEDRRAVYKTNVSIAGGRQGGRVYYFSASPGGVDLAGGLHTPSRDQLRRFRELQDDAKAVRPMDALLEELDGEGFSMMEEGALKTAPRRWSRDHPRVDVLRYEHLAVGQDREPGPWLGTAACLDEVAAAWRIVGRWNAWLEDRVGIPLEATGPSGTSARR